jgi:DNA processing protein
LDLEDAPERLFLHGVLPRGPAVAVVGTRHPSAESAAYAGELSFDLARAGAAVFSGGAEGIDAAAHRGALEAGGKTVVVAPAGILRAYPEKHHELFAQILAAGGAYVSRCAPDVAATWASFFPRNALLVALAHVVVVVESPCRSGARNAAQHARRLGRTLFVVPQPPWNSRGRGNILELALGARPLASAKDVLRQLRTERAHAIARDREDTPASGAEGGDAEAVAQQTAASGQQALFDGVFWPAATAGERLILEALRVGATSADALVVATGLPARAVQSTLAVLAARRLVATDPSGRVRLTGPSAQGQHAPKRRARRPSR